MLRKESKTGVRSFNETRKLSALKKKNKKNKSTKTEKTAAAAGGARRNPRRSSPVEYGGETNDAFMRKIDGGMDEEAKQRLAKMLRGDDSCASASDDDGSACEVCLPFPPDLWLVGACVLRKRDDAGPGVVARIRGLRFG